VLGSEAGFAAEAAIPIDGFVEVLRRTESDWEIEEMDLGEAQLTGVIEQIGARKLALSLRGAAI
jgi:hypothetical protein